MRESESNDEFKKQHDRATKLLSESNSFILLHFDEYGVETVMAIDLADQRFALEATHRLSKELARGILEGMVGDMLERLIRSDEPEG